MARPKKDKTEARTVRLNLRLMPDERAEIEAKAAAAGLSPTEFARLAALGGRIEAVLPRSSPPSSGGASSGAPDNVAHVVALNRVGVNLNQIARNLNSGLGLVPAELDACLARVNGLLDEWQGVTS